MRYLLLVLAFLFICGLAYASSLGIDMTLNISTGGGAGGLPPSGGTFELINGNYLEWIGGGYADFI